MLRKLVAAALVVAVCGTAAGVAYAKVMRTPNTLDAHRLIGLADTEGVQDAVVEAVFRAYFTEGRDISRATVLFDVVAEAGLDRNRAEAVLNSGETVPLEFAGLGPSLKQQAAPLTFRVIQAPRNISVGRPVTVILQSGVELIGIVLPASSVVRAPSGLSIVWVKTGPERFEPHTVRYEPLDGQRVVVLSGLKADMRVVTDGATLLNQIR